MAFARPFAYNTGASISGTTQVGSLAVGTPASGFTGMEWWNGPDEELGYVIAQSVSGDTQPTPVSGVTASVGFNRTSYFCDSEFVSLANRVSNQSYTAATEAASGLTSLGYWNSYSCSGTPLISTTSLLAYYKFDNNGQDSSGNNLNLTASGTPQYISGRYCDSFRGQVSDYLNGPLNQYPPTTAATKDLSVAFWWTGGINSNNTCEAWPTGNLSYRQLLYYKNDQFPVSGSTGWWAHFYKPDSNTWQVGVFAHKLQLNYTYYTGSRGPACDGVGWHHYAFTYNDSTYDLKLYYNGEMVVSGNSGQLTIAQNSIPLRVTRQTNTNNNFVLDELSIWNRVLSDSEIQTLASTTCPLL
jgi:hypothetical protein